MTEMELKAWMDGEIAPLHDLQISVTDRGFLYGDGVFESMLVRGSTIPLKSYHLDRLRRSIRKTSLSYPGNRFLDEALEELIEAHSFDSSVEYVIKILVTAGTGSGLHRSSETDQRILLFPRSLGTTRTEAREMGYEAFLRESTGTTGKSLATIKSLSRMEQSIYLEEIPRHKHERPVEPLIYGENGKLLEGATKNVFLSLDGQWKTPRVSEGILPGVCRQILLEHSERTEEYPLFVRDLFHADHLVFTSSSLGPVPIRTVHTSSVRSKDSSKITFPDLPGDHSLYQTWDRAIEAYAE